MWYQIKWETVPVNSGPKKGHTVNMLMLRAKEQWLILFPNRGQTGWPCKFHSFQPSAVYVDSIHLTWNEEGMHKRLLRIPLLHRQKKTKAANNCAHPHLFRPETHLPHWYHTVRLPGEPLLCPKETRNASVEWIYTSQYCTYCFKRHCSCRSKDIP